MGYNLSTAKMRIEGESFTTVKWVTDVLMWLNYAYNLAAVMDEIDRGGPDDIELLRAVIKGAPESGILAAILTLEPLIEEGARIRLECLDSGHTFDIKITGIDKVIDVLASIFDPSRRADRKEDRKAKEEKRRHKTEMNKSKERVVEARAANEVLIEFEQFLDRATNLHRRLVDQYGEDRAQRILAQINGEYARAIGLQPASEVKMIGGIEPA